MKNKFIFITCICALLVSSCNKKVIINTIFPEVVNGDIATFSIENLDTSFFSGLAVKIGMVPCAVIDSKDGLVSVVVSGVSIGKKDVVFTLNGKPIGTAEMLVNDLPIKQFSFELDSGRVSFLGANPIPEDRGNNINKFHGDSLIAEVLDSNGYTIALKPLYQNVRREVFKNPGEITITRATSPQILHVNMPNNSETSTINIYENLQWREKRYNPKYLQKTFPINSLMAIDTMGEIQKGRLVGSFNVR